MKKTKNEGAERSEGIANGANEEVLKMKGAIKIMLLLEDNTIEDSTAQEIDSMLKQYGY